MQIYYPSLEIFRHQKLSHAFQTLRSIVKSNSSLLHLRKTQNSYNFIDITYSISLFCSNLWLMNLQTREHCTVSASNLSRTPKLMQRNYKLNKLTTMEWMELFFFSAKSFVYLLTLPPAHLFAIRRRLQR